MNFPAETPSAVRYIKLGSARDKATATCLDRGEAFVHFGTNDPAAFDFARSGNWDGFRNWRLKMEMQRVERRELSKSKAEANATSARNQVESFVEADDSVLWFTFHKGRLYWAFMDDSVPAAPDPERGYVRQVRGGWKSTSAVEGRPLLFEDLSGRLTRTAAYRSTTCGVSKEAAAYLVRRLRDEEPVAAVAARDHREAFLSSLVGVLEKFTFKDFELLSELALTSLGWRRRSLTGSAMEFVDTVLEQPLTGEVVAAQVKSVLKVSDLKSYGEKFEEYSAKNGGSFTTFYFVYHTDRKGVADGFECPSDMVLIGPRELAEIALRAGLADWMIERIL